MSEKFAAKSFQHCHFSACQYVTALVLTYDVRETISWSQKPLTAVLRNDMHVDKVAFGECSLGCDRQEQIAAQVRLGQSRARDDQLCAEVRITDFQRRR